jgi:hypothetical protein
MRQMTLASLMVALVLTPLHGQNSALDVTLPSVRIPSALQPCDIHGIVQRLGRIVKLPVGFQGGPECIGKSDMARAGGGWLVDQRFSTAGDTIDLAGSTLRQALDRLVALAPDYRWKEINGMAVVRPVTAWDDREDGLNRQVAPFDIVNERLSSAVQIMLGRIGSGDTTGRINATSATLTFSGGTLLDALGALTQSYHAGGWDVATVVDPPPGYEPGPNLVIVVRANDRPQGAALSTAIALSRLSR